MSTIAGRWDDYSLGVAIKRHGDARDDANARIEAIDDEIKALQDEQSRLGELACRHYNAQIRLEGVRRRMRAPLSEPMSDMSAFVSTLALIRKTTRGATL